jgi:hypothetical protein
MKRLLFLLFSANFCVLADSRYFEIDDVEIKQKGANSLAAKQEALRKSARAAFEKAISAEAKRLPAGSASDREIQDCVYDYSIEQEKISASFYVGRFSYRFLKDKIAAFLKSRGAVVGFEVEESKGEKVKLAVYREDFINRANELKKLKIAVEEFSNQRVVFKINKNRVPNFQELRIKYASL